MEINPVREGRKKMEDLFIKFEQVLQENEVVIGTLMAKAYLADEDLSKAEQELVDVLSG